MEQAEIESLVGAPLRLTLDEISSHPRLAEARRAHLDAYLAIYSGDPFIVRLLIESGRFMVYHIAAVLEAGADPARRETWPTIKRLKEAMALFGFASGRHVDQLVARLCSVGFMDLTPAAEDRRVRILSPSEKLRAHDRDWLAAHVTPLTVLYPRHDYEAAMKRDAKFHALYRRVSVPFLPLGAKLLLSLPESLLFFNRAAGSLVEAALLQAAMAAPSYPHAAVPYADIGERFGVSRTHVRQILEAAEEAGLVKLHARGGRRVEILPRHWSSYDRGLAAGMYIHDMVYVATQRALRTDADAREADLTLA